jgi:Tfp pilus assembly protein PilF
MKQILILSIILITIFSCSVKKQKKDGEYDPKAVALNKKAMELMNQLKDDSALILFDEAIKADDSYYLPHANKVGIFISHGRYGTALAESEKAIKKNPDYAEGYTITGMLTEKQGDSIKAIEYYKKSIELFDLKINDPKNKERLTQLRLSRAVSMVLAGEVAEAKKELANLQKENPNDPMIKNFQDINKKQFIEQLLP